MLPVAEFGRTGHRSTRVIFGAAAIGSMSQERADETLALIASRGVNHIDTILHRGETGERSPATPAVRPTPATSRCTTVGWTYRPAVAEAHEALYL